MILPEAEVADGLADDHPPFNSQDNQRPERNLTTEGSKESFQVAAEASKDKVAVHRGVHRCGESSKNHKEVSHCKVQQDVVKRGSQLLVFKGDVQSEEVDGEAEKDEQEHVGAQSSIGCRVDKVVLRVFIRTPYNTGGVHHRDIEEWSLRAVHGCGLCLRSAPWRCFFWLLTAMETDLTRSGPTSSF